VSQFHIVTEKMQGSTSPFSLSSVSQVITDIRAKAEMAKLNATRAVEDGTQVITDIRAKAESIKGKVQFAVASASEVAPAGRPQTGSATSNPATMRQAEPVASRDTKEVVEKQNIENICALGFPTSAAKFALERKDGNPDEAVLWLLEFHHSDEFDDLESAKRTDSAMGPSSVPNVRTRPFLVKTCTDGEADGRGLGTKRQSWVTCPAAVPRICSDDDSMSDPDPTSPCSSVSSSTVLFAADEAATDEENVEEHAQDENTLLAVVSKADADDNGFSEFNAIVPYHSDVLIFTDSVKAYISNITLNDRKSFLQSQPLNDEGDKISVSDVVVDQDPENGPVLQVAEAAESLPELLRGSPGVVSVFQSAKLFAKRVAEDGNQVITDIRAKVKTVTEDGSQANVDMRAKAESMKGKVQTAVAAASAAASAARPGISAVSSVTWDRIEQLTSSHDKDASDKKKNIENICALGFSMAASNFALEQSGGDPDAACEWLFDYHKSRDAPDSESTRLLESALVLKRESKDVDLTPQREPHEHPLADNTTMLSNQPCCAASPPTDLMVHAQMEQFMAGVSLDSLPLLSNIAVAPEAETESGAHGGLDADSEVASDPEAEIAVGSEAGESEGDEQDPVAVEPPQSSSWDWPLTRLEKKTRVQTIERQMHILDQQTLMQELVDLRQRSLSSLDDSTCSA